MIHSFLNRKSAFNIQDYRIIFGEDKGGSIPEGLGPGWIHSDDVPYLSREGPRNANQT